MIPTATQKTNDDSEKSKYTKIALKNFSEIIAEKFTSKGKEFSIQINELCRTLNTYDQKRATL